MTDGTGVSVVRSGRAEQRRAAARTLVGRLSAVRGTNLLLADILPTGPAV
jgi:hypothetical protein